MTANMSGKPHSIANAARCSSSATHSSSARKSKVVPGRIGRFGGFTDNVLLSGAADPARNSCATALGAQSRFGESRDLSRPRSSPAAPGTCGARRSRNAARQDHGDSPLASLTSDRPFPSEARDPALLPLFPLAGRVPSAPPMRLAFYTLAIYMHDVRDTSREFLCIMHKVVVAQSPNGEREGGSTGSVRYAKIAARSSRSVAYRTTSDTIAKRSDSAAD